MGADLTQAQLGSTTGMHSLGGPLKAFKAADLRGATLRDATLTNAYMREVDMSRLEPNISDPGLLRDEGRTNLSNADLRYAAMFGADLRNAILNGADFTCADLAHADFTGATGITPKQLENQARNLSEATMPDGTKYVQQQPTLRSSPGPEIGATMPDGNIRARILERCIRPDGTISAGPYTTEQFEPALSFSVGDGWRIPYAVTTDALAIEDLEGNEFNFNNPLRVVDPSNLSDPKEVPAPESAEEWASWFQSHPYLDTSEPIQVSVGGASGVRIDVTDRSVPKNYPKALADYCGPGPPCVPLFPYGSVHLIASSVGYKDQFVIVDVEGESVVIDVAAPVDEFDAFLPKAQKVLDTVEWRGG